MARTFRTRRSMHPVAELNVTNLIDVAFTLLIIFMIATPLINNQEQTIPLNLPVESQSEQAKPDPDTQFVAVTVKMDRGQPQYFISGAPVTLSALRTRLADLGRERKQPVMRVRAEGNINYQYVITLLDELKKNGLNKISFDTQTES